MPVRHPIASLTPFMVPVGTKMKMGHLAVFMLSDNYSNDMAFARKWQSIGNHRYRDTRVLKIILPDGEDVEIQHEYIFDFSKPTVLESEDESAGTNGQKALIWSARVN
jgi:hypothetical protein